ncbi:Argininosuccinate lyase (plasmid) [Variovorax sp. SRS16]|uniref:tripartite tricarboxylate transporter substrate binding protein n=1 Tax=Variovorax sp. SRS16 TaxID=282217 RepID=UPI0013174068|nr:tripartite tricarboxylate transporter substrate binding protein [Variovorax sp. SRS16]VTU45687.1 Argininosuccinate lyase [Variovorax sp. SRS16]
MTFDSSPRDAARKAPARSLRHAMAALAALGIAALLATGPAGAEETAQKFPSHAVRLVVPYPPGGSVDPVARLMSQKLTELWGQQVVVDNRPGASTIIGTDVVAKAPADGYTLLLTASTHVSNALLFHNLPYDSFKDFAPITPVYKADFVLVETPSVPANTLQEFIAYAKANPGKISYASAGAGNANHMAAELFSRMAGVKMLHVPYKGGGPLINDMLSGQVQLYFAVPVSVQQLIQTGKLKALATTSEARLPLIPNVPTFAEAGLPGFGMRSWIGLLAPARTPKPIIDKINADMARVLAMPDVRQRMESQGTIPFSMDPPHFAAMMKEDLGTFDQIIKAADIKIEQ